MEDDVHEVEVVVDEEGMAAVVAVALVRAMFGTVSPVPNLKVKNCGVPSGLMLCSLPNWKMPFSPGGAKRGGSVGLKPLRVVGALVALGVGVVTAGALPMVLRFVGA